MMNRWLLLLLFLCCACCPYAHSTTLEFTIDKKLKNEQVTEKVRDKIEALFALVNSKQFRDCMACREDAELYAIVHGKKVKPCGAIKNSQCADMKKQNIWLTDWWWDGKITYYDLEDAVVEVGYYSNWRSRGGIGHAARIERANSDTLEVSVNSIGVYCSRMFDKEYAEKLKNHMATAFSVPEDVKLLAEPDQK